jgi:hypothetical protein
MVLAAIKKAKYVCLTMDIWTDRRQHAFLVMTGHTFVHCRPKSFLVTFQAFRVKHTGERIAQAVDDVLTKNRSLEHKVKVIVSDSASNMKRAFDVLGDIREARNRAVEEAAATSNDVEDEDDQLVLAVDDETVWEGMNEEQSAEVESVLDNANVTRVACFAHSLQLVIRDGFGKLTSSTVLAKCSALATKVHHSALFKSAFEDKFGKDRSVPTSNATRWNSLFHQLKAVAALPADKLSRLLRENDHANLIFSGKEKEMLNELVTILEPFAEATDKAQGENEAARIGCIVPIIIALRKMLMAQLETIKNHTAFVRALLISLEERFQGLLSIVGVLPAMTAAAASKTFGNIIYPISSVLDPTMVLYG